MSEPDVGSDLRGMKTRARRDVDDFVIHGTKHFISHADESSFVVLFAATGEEDTPRGLRALITAFLIDRDTAGFTVEDGYRSVAHRGHNNSILRFDDCRVHKSQVLGELHRPQFRRTRHRHRPGMGQECIEGIEARPQHAFDMVDGMEQF